MDNSRACNKRHYRISPLQIVCILAGLLLLLTGVILVFHNFWEEYQAGLHSQEILTNVRTSLQEETSSDYNSINGSMEDFSPASPESEQEISSQKKDDAIGILHLPDLDLTLPVLGEYSESLLKTAPCVFSGSWEQGLHGLVIAGHNYKTHFQDIERLKPGTVFTFQTLDRITHFLQVEEVTQDRKSVV